MPNWLGTLLVLVAAAVAVSPSAAATEAPGSASVKLAACSADSHSAAFKARMRWVEGTDRMWLRFRLLRKGPGGFHVLKARGLDRWRKSKPGVGTFAYRQGVRGLQAGAVYRVAVDFRWYDTDGTLIQTTRRHSPSCRQFEALPNLTARLGDSSEGSKAGVLRYHLRVANSGIAPANQVPVRLLVDGSIVDTVTVASLAPGERRWLTIQGPECSSSVEAIADPDGVIVESSEGDNEDQRACADLPER